MTVEVIVGCWDVHRPQWADSYYPEDLPVSWQFGYFANEYRTAVIPQSSWQNFDEEMWQDLVTDLSEEFHLFVQCSSLPTLALIDHFKAMGESLQGIIAPRGLQRALEELLPDVPLIDEAGLEQGSYRRMEIPQKLTPLEGRRLLEELLSGVEGKVLYVWLANGAHDTENASQLRLLAELMGH